MMYLVHYDDNEDYWASSPQLRAYTGLISDTAKVRNELAALGALKAPNIGSLDEIFQNLIRENCEMQWGRLPVTVAFQSFLIGRRTHTAAQTFPARAAMARAWSISSVKKGLAKQPGDEQRLTPRSASASSAMKRKGVEMLGGRSQNRSARIATRSHEKPEGTDGACAIV
jgi:hypothetical protein